MKRCVVCKKLLWAHWFGGMLYSAGHDLLCESCFALVEKDCSGIHLHDDLNRVVIGSCQYSGRFANEDWAKGRLPDNWDPLACAFKSPAAMVD